MLTVNLNVTPPWGEGDAKRIMDALGGPDNVLAVGGCVRDWITGIPVKDIDFATKHPPIKCSGLLEKKGFKVKPVGIEHGTIKVILKGKIFEITTLRKDIITDGRHAVVKFGKDWYDDACRRDFTLNALYGDDQGTIYDPLNKGFKDLQEGKLCFIGDPKKRIKEDFLRIIRYFRFLSRFSKNIHELSLKACIKEAKNIRFISGERIISETSKILLSANASFVINEMQSHDLLKYMFTEQKDYSLAIQPKILKEYIQNISLRHKPKKKFLILLSLLLKNENRKIIKKIILSISNKFNLSKNDNRLLVKMTEWVKSTRSVSAKDIKLVWLDFGKEEIEYLKLILKIINFKQYTILRKYLENQPPKFPCTGKDAKKIGFVQGDKMGNALKNTRNWWLDKNCLPTYEDCMKQLKKNL